jgi:uncharacterized protein
MTRHVMVLPSLACPASCSYCFGPHSGGTRMGLRTIEATAAWLASGSARSLPEDLELTFHGGEPLSAGVDFFKEALPRFRNAWQVGATCFTLQSNLWLLDEALLDVFSEVSLSIGTSLDGPEDVNDAQRGKGYFKRTMAGIEKARRRDMPVGCIATFTDQSAKRWRDVVDFFMREGLNFSIHAALPVIGRRGEQPWVLEPDAYAALMTELIGYYLENLQRLKINTLDAMIRSVSSGRSGVCTFGNCLGGYLAVDPGGGIYPCQRFCGMSEFKMGNVEQSPWPFSLQEGHPAPVDVLTLEESETWKRFERRQARMQEECKGCDFLDICQGGCPYNVLAAASGPDPYMPVSRDPYCAAYQKIYTTIVERAIAEVFAPENIAAVVDQPQAQGGMLQKGALLELMSGRAHRSETV